MKKVKKIFSTLHGVTNTLLTGVLLLAVIFFILTTISPSKNFLLYKVISGSMEPTIKTGSVVFVKQTDIKNLSVGTIISYSANNDANTIVTHRISGISTKDNQQVYRTKGDANAGQDADEISPERIKGIVLFSVPSLGFFLDWIKTPLGFIVTIIIPALYIIITEILRIKKIIEEEAIKNYKKTDGKKMTPLLILAGFLIMNIIHQGSTQSYFSSGKVLSDNVFSTPCWTSPSVPTSSSPSNGANLSVTNISLYWNISFSSCPLAFISYTYEVATDVSFVNPLYTSGSTTSTTITLSSIPEGTYFWRVKATDQFTNASAYSTVRSFSIDRTAPMVSVGAGNNGGNGTRKNSDSLPEPIVNAPSNTSPVYDSVVIGTIPVYATASDPHMMRYHFRIIKDGETENGKDPMNGNGYAKGGYVFTTVINENLGFDSRIDFDPTTAGVQDLDTSRLPNGTYWLIIGARDTLGQRNAPNADQDPRIKITVNDGVPPTISSVTYLLATPNNENEPAATITWNTDRLSTSTIEWNINGSGWTFLPTDTNLVTSHREVTPNLLPNTHYQYRVHSSDIFGNEAISAIFSFETSDTRIGLDYLSAVVINEFLPNPSGSDDALKPGGEWVELYNRSKKTIDLSGWYLSDVNPSHKLPITLTNTETSDTATTGLLLGPKEFMVVYKNGDSDFSLNNSYLGDTVILYRPSGWPADLHLYTGLLGEDISENKSFIRYPDGSDTWFDPIPSPGRPNTLEGFLLIDSEASIATASPTPIESEPTGTLTLTPTPTLTLTPTPTPEPKIPSVTIAKTGNDITFLVSHVETFKTLKYELTYTHDDKLEGIMSPTVDLTGEQEYKKENLYLGTCSSGGTCIPHEKVSAINLTVTLVDSAEKEFVLTASL